MTRVGLTVLVVISLARAPEWNAASAAPAPPRIESLIHNVRGTLLVGDRLTISLRGTARGSATFHIFGVAADVGTREIRNAAYAATPALYMGTYVVRPGDSARNAAVFATLSVGGQETMMPAARSITIDTRPPVITSRQPKPSANLSNLRPNIVVTFFDGVSGVNPGAVRLLVNRQDVTARAAISETAVTYNPAVPFAPGPVRVQLIATDRARNVERTEWGFTILPSNGLIQSVTINPAIPLTSGDTLTVVMAGAPGGKASFAIQGLPGTVPMRESRTPGLYVGNFGVPPRPSVSDAAVLVTLEKDGRRATAAATATVTVLSTPPPAPTISQGVAALVGGVGRLALRGRSQPGVRILGRIAYRTQPPTAEIDGVLGEFSTVTGSDGNWQLSIGPLIPFDGARLSVTVVAVDAAGQRSPATSIEVTQ